MKVRISSGSLLASTLERMLVALALLGVAPGLAGCEDPPPTKSAALGSSLDLAAGEVALVNEEGAVVTRLLSGTPLPVGARLRTGPGARALVRLGDGTRLFLRDETTVQLDEGVTLESGQAWLEAPALEAGQAARAHVVGDATVSLSDGGASLALADGAASVYVAEGLAVVTSPGGRTEVNAGEQATISGAAAPKVEPVKFWEDWTGGMGDRSAGARAGRSGSGALYAIDRGAPPGSPALPLSVQRQTVHVAIEDEVAETRVDQRFFNPSGNEVEGWYWFSVPEDAQLVSFALETDGQLIEGEVVERQQAAQTYEQAVQRQRDPALLEWVDPHTVRARIYPVPALGERRIVVRYQQLLAETEGKIHYRYPLAGPAGKDAPTIEEFSLEVQLRGELAKEFSVASLTEARVEGEGERVTMRRSGYTPRADFELELARKSEKSQAAQHPVRVNEIDPGADQARFLMLRYMPDLDFDAVESLRGDVVVVVDTSAGGDASEHQTKLAVAEALLRSLSAGDRFAVMSADISARVLYPESELAEASPESISAALEAVAEHGTGGATDLGEIFERALERVHGLEQPAIVYVGDGLATSGERSGDALAERLRRSITGSRARLFTVGVGADVDEALLARLARVGGGESLRVQLPEEAVVRALQLSGALKTPTITDLEVDVGEGLDDVFVNVSGKLTRGRELVLLARTHHDLPDKITVRGRLAGEDFEKEYEVERTKGVLDAFVPRLWAQTYVERLLGDSRGPEAVRGKVLGLGLEYGLMTPYTSFLALESEQAYAQSGIQRRPRRFPGPRLTASAQWMRGGEPEASATVLGMFMAAVSAPLGCSARDAAEQAREEAKSEWDAPVEAPRATPSPPASAPASGTDAVRHAGEEGSMGNLQAKNEAPPMDPAPSMPTRSAAGPGGYADDVEAAEAPAFEPSDEAVGGIGASAGLTTGDGGARKGLGRDPAEKIAEAGAGQVAEGESDLDALGTEEFAGPAGGQGRAAQVEHYRREAKALAITSPVSKYRKLPCSDAAARNLAHRRILWTKRLERQPTMEGWLEVYEASAGSCEISGWKDQRVFLQLLQARVQTEHDVALLLAHFSDQPDAHDYLARALLRRLVEPRLVAAVENALFGDRVDWRTVDHRMTLETDDAKQLEILQQALARAPGDPQGERRVIAFLVRNGKLDEAVAHGRRLRERGQLTPDLVQQLGEVLVRAQANGEDSERQLALRLFSEIVEFDPHSQVSRRLLGDIFLRHGWYDEAYRQFEDLIELAPEDATASIRLARAAAGTGRVDEGLRLLRQVAAGEGRPGADDPRRWARLLAAAYLAGLLESKDAPAASVTRELKRLELFEGPTTWKLVVWEDLEARLVLAEDEKPGKARGEPQDAGTSTALGDSVDGAPTGLFAVQVPPAGLPAVKVRHRGLRLDRDVAYEVLTIRFDGTGFSVARERGSVPAHEASDQRLAAREAVPAPTDG